MNLYKTAYILTNNKLKNLILTKGGDFMLNNLNNSLKNELENITESNVISCFIDESGLQLGCLQNYGLKMKQVYTFMARGVIIYEGNVVSRYDENGFVEPKNRILYKNGTYMGIRKSLTDASIEAIDEILDYLIQNNMFDKEVTIYLDNKSIPEALNDKNNKLYNQFKDKIELFPKIKFLWLERSFNKIAHGLAYEKLKESIDIDLLGNIHSFIVSLSNEIKTKNIAIDNLESDLKDYKKQVSQLKNRIDALNKKLKNNVFDLNEYPIVIKENTKKYKTKIKKQEKVIVKLRKQLKEFEYKNKRISDLNIVNF